MTDDHRDCIPPPEPSAWVHRWRLSRQLDRLEKRLAETPSTKSWRDIEETAKDTIKPMKKQSKQTKPRYEVSDPTTYRCLGVVEGDNYIEAAWRAAHDIFKRQSAQRDTGWPGNPGMFSAFDADGSRIEFFLKVER